MLKIIPLGGCGEIGLNMMVFQFEDHIIVIDAGLMFPEDFMLGVDAVIPDFQYLKENHDKIRAIILTHGHEDHIGAMPFLAREISAPVFGTPFTLALLKDKFEEHQGLDHIILNEINIGDRIVIGPFQVEFIRVHHSIVDGTGLAIKTPEGIVIHSGDFKIDHTPAGSETTDIIRFASYGEKGVLALLSDSTNSEKEGRTSSEKDVVQTIEEIIRESNGRIIVAVFASHINRIKQIIEIAIKYGRKVVFSGKSMITNVGIAQDKGFINLNSKDIIEEGEINSFPDEKLLFITTGTQGEAMSSLARIAQDRHKNIKIKQGDTVIISSRFIPGNERAISSTINNLYRMGAKVIYEKISHIHSSGHAYQDELKLLINLVRPKYLIPIHGEFRHLVMHKQVALETGIEPERILLAENGTTICFEDGRGWLGERVPCGRVLVDGKGVGDVDEPVLRDRRKLSADGIVVALLAINERNGRLIYGPDIVSRGFVFGNETGFILEEAKCIVLEVLDEINGFLRMNELEQEIKKRLNRFFFSVIQRRPLIVTIVIPL